MFFNRQAKHPKKTKTKKQYLCSEFVFEMKKSRFPLAFALCALLLISACHRKEKVATPPMTPEQEVKVKNVEIDFLRYEQQLFSLDPNHLSEGIESLYGKVPSVLVAKDSWKDANMIKSLQGYLSDPTIKELYKETQKQYPNLDNLKKELTDAFRIYLTHFPEDSVPKIVTMISGMDFSIPSVWGYDNYLFINLDMYLGQNYKYYALSGMPKFISARCDKKYIASDCFTKVMAYKHLPDKTLVTALDNMLDEGKKLFLTQTMFPNKSPQDIIGYSADKYAWIEKNEGNVWQYLMDKNMIYSKDEEVIRQLVGETPFTRVFGNDSPGRIGAYIGWKIIQNYMKQHPETSLQDIMIRTDSQKILSESHYKPSFK